MANAQSTHDDGLVVSTRSLERDAVRLGGLRRRADLNDCYGVMQRRLTPVMYAVRVGDESIVVTLANVTFVTDDTVPSVAVYPRSTFSRPPSTDDLRRALVLDDDLYAVYSCDPRASP